MRRSRSRSRRRRGGVKIEEWQGEISELMVVKYHQMLPRKVSKQQIEGDCLPKRTGITVIYTELTWCAKGQTPRSSTWTRLLI